MEPGQAGRRWNKKHFCSSPLPSPGRPPRQPRGASPSPAPAPSWGRAWPPAPGSSLALLAPGSGTRTLSAGRKVSRGRRGGTGQGPRDPAPMALLWADQESGRRSVPRYSGASAAPRCMGASAQSPSELGVWTANQKPLTVLS